MRARFAYAFLLALAAAVAPPRAVAQAPEDVPGPQQTDASTDATIEDTEAVEASAVPDVPPPSQEETNPNPTGFRFEAAPGRGLTIAHGDAFSFTVRSRAQIRHTLTTAPSSEATHDIQIRTLRLWLLGHVMNPNVRYGIQLAFGARDFERVGGATNATPIFDAFVDLVHSRDASVRIGQFFVPFDRLRTIREFALQSVDRSTVIRELTLDRDVGVMVYSDDLGGHDGRYVYRLGVFGGDGRNQFDARSVGFLYTARFAYRPFGAFDDDSEGDLARRTTPKLAIGIAGAYNQNTHRFASTTGEFFTLSDVDYVHGAVDLVFKYRGFALMAEAVLRGSTTSSHSGVDGDGNPITETATRAIGYLAQVSYLPTQRFEVWSRWDEVRLPFATSTAMQTLVASRGRGLAGGFNVYFNGHGLKVQADVAHVFGEGSFDGNTQYRLQLDASF